MADNSARKLSEKYIVLQNEIKAVFARALKLKQMTVEDLLKALVIFSFTDTEQELEIFLDLFSDEFPALKQITEKQAAREKSELELKIKQVVSAMIKTNPMKAAEISKAALKPGMTWDELKKLFPEL